MYSVLSLTKPFYLVSRSHGTVLSKYLNTLLQFVATSCLRRTTSYPSIDVIDHCGVYTETCVNVYLISEAVCSNVRHMTFNFRGRFPQIPLFLFSATPHDLVCFYDLVTLLD